MSRKGFAMLTALWLIAALSVISAASLAVANTGSAVTRNRLVLVRAGWAREACAEILLARYAERGRIVAIDTVALGRGAWCRATVEDAGGRLDLNRIPRDMLLGMLGDDSLTDALLDWRDRDDVPRQYGVEAEWYRSLGRRAPRNGPLADIAELRFVRGFDDARVTMLEKLVTVRGAEPIDVNAAPAGVLAVLPGIGGEAISLILRRREAGQRIGSHDELLSLLSPGARQAVLDRFQEYSLQAGYQPSRVTVRVEGGVTGTALVSAARLTVVPLPNRLAVIRRESE